MRIAHIITRLILGGAQENTVLCCEDLLRQYGDDVLLVTGPPLGPEGSLLERARAGGVPLEIIDPLRRPIHPWRDFSSYLQIKKAIKPQGGWNECIVLANGTHITYTINGELMTDMTDNSPKGRKDGVIALQMHAGCVMEVRFKNIEMLQE